MNRDQGSDSRRPPDKTERETCDPPSSAVHGNAESPADVLPDNFRSCLDGIPDLMCLKGDDLEYLFVNKAFCNILDVNPTDVLGKRATDVYPKDVGRKLETMDLLVLATNKPVEEEVKIGDRLFEMRKFPISLQNRGLVVVNGRDITERKQAEQALLTEKIRFEILSDNTPLGMLLLDGNGAVKYLNAGFRDLFGYDPEDIPDGPTWFRRAFPGREFEDDLARILTRVDKVKGWKEREQQTLTATRRDGTLRMVSIEAVQLASGDIVVSCDDVAERATIESEAVSRVDHDALTGLPNGLSLERAMRIAVDHAREARRRRAPGAVLFVEARNMDVLSEKHGRLAFDEGVAAFGKTLRGILRSGDTTYRLSGGQFAVLFKGISMAEARLAAVRIQNTMNARGFQIAGEKMTLAISGALLTIDGGEEPDELLRTGLSMMMDTRSNGINQITVKKPLN
jgi:diguanylate cyclase (GGDEF)-like protein/PAS domain S-box-containing protein